MELMEDLLMCVVWFMAGFGGSTIIQILKARTRAR